MIHSTQLHSIRSQNKEQEYLAGWQRALAELDNFRKRTQTEQKTLRKRLKQEISQPLLEVADNFQALIHHVPPGLAKNSWVEGVTHIARQFDRTLAEFGVSGIDEVGQEFDPALHEAVAQEKKRGYGSGIVIEVLQPGYRIGEMVIRPAKVKVSA